MKLGEKIAFIIYTVAIIICFSTTIVIIKQDSINRNKIIELTNKLKQYEDITVPSTGDIDSIKVNISYKDSIIKQIKIEYIKDVEWVKNIPDSTAITLFNQLVWANSNSDR